MPNRINSLIFSVLSLCLGAHVALAQSSIPRTTSGGARPAARKSTVPQSGGSPRSNSLPQTTRPPAGRVDATAEAAENAAEEQKAAPNVRQQAMQGPEPAQQPLPGAQVVQQVSEEMKQVLEEWEEKTKDINTLYCPITRYEFDKVFGKETRSIGKIYFENPDKGRIDFQPADDARMKSAAGRQLPNGAPFTVVPGNATQWICTGKMIYIKEMATKTYDRVQIPPQMQGKNITNSPLPFIFGMKADDAVARFKLTFGPFHNPDGKKVAKNGKPLRKVLHIVANPKDKNVAKEYIQAEIVLDPETFLPLNLRTTDPAGNKETVYSFDQPAMKVGCSWGLNNPFREPILVGWTLNNDVKAAPEPVQKAQGDESEAK